MPNNTVRVATWNVNSLRVRLPQVLDWLGIQQPDILALQETKLPDHAFPVHELAGAGYHVVYAGQPAYNGVAILSRQPVSAVMSAVPGMEDEQRRVLGASIAGLRVLNLYVPNGQSLDSDKYTYKLAWLQQVSAWVRSESAAHPHLVVLGDFNIAPQDRDVYDAQIFAGQVLCSAAERAAFHDLQQFGLQDAFRLFAQEERSFTHWDYRGGAFRRNWGVRIDHILLSPLLAAACQRCWIDQTPRRWPRPSDHAPLLADLELDAVG